MTDSMRPDDPMRRSGARWCDEHGRWECSRNTKSGQPCHESAIAGRDVGRMHAGESSSKARARGEANLLAWSVMGDDVPHLASSDVMLRLLHMSWVRVHLYAERLRVLVEDSVENEGLVGATFAAGRNGERVESGEQVRALAKLEADERDRCARFAKLCHDMRIDERHIELQQAQAQLVVQAFLGAVAALGLVPADRDLALRTFLQGLGRGPETTVVAGEVSA